MEYSRQFRPGSLVPSSCQSGTNLSTESHIIEWFALLRPCQQKHNINHKTLNRAMRGIIYIMSRDSFTDVIYFGNKIQVFVLINVIHDHISSWTKTRVNSSNGWSLSICLSMDPSFFDLPCIQALIIVVNADSTEDEMFLLWQNIKHGYGTSMQRCTFMRKLIRFVVK